MVEVENRMVVDSQWPVDNEQIVPGYFNRYGLFVREEYLLEVALEDTQKDPITRDSFLEKVLDHIEKNEDEKEKFLRWFYPEYKGER